MKAFFEVSTKRVKRRYLFLLALCNAPSVYIFIATLLTLVLGIGKPMPYLWSALSAMFFALAASALICFLGFLRIAPALRYHKRYTYVEVADETVLFSKYLGKALDPREEAICRRLYVIPLRSVESLKRLSKTTLCITAKGGDSFCVYEGHAAWLSYTIFRGNVRFDNWWYNENGSTSAREVTLSADFASPTKLFRTIETAKKRQDERKAEEPAAATTTEPNIPPIAHTAQIDRSLQQRSHYSKR